MLHNVRNITCSEISNLSADYQSKRPDFFFFNLAAPGCSLTTRDLHCVMWDLSLRLTDSSCGLQA